MLDSNCDTEFFPLPFDGHDIQLASTSSLDVYRWNVNLSRIRNRYCAVLNRHETVVVRLDTLADLDNALMRWRDEIPLEYRPDQENLAPREAYHLVAFIHLEYFNLLRALHWASVMCVLANKDVAASHRSPRIRASQSICLEAARSFVKTLNK